MIGENDTYPEKGFPAIKDLKHSVPKLALIAMTLLMMICIGVSQFTNARTCVQDTHTHTQETETRDRDRARVTETETEG